MFAALSFLPVIGTLINSVSHVFDTWNQTKMAKDANDLQEIKIRLENQRKDIRLQLQQDMIVFPVAIWTMLFTWKQIVVEQYPDLVWNIAPLESIIFLPVLAYLFGLPIRDKFTK